MMSISADTCGLSLNLYRHFVLYIYVFKSMWVAVNRLTTSGKVLGSEECITPEQALLAYTREAAIVLGIEDKVGNLEPGKYADFVVLSDNPMNVDPLKIKDIKVEATVMNGEITYLTATKGGYHH